MATATKKTTGFRIPCPHCTAGIDDGQTTLKIDLSTVKVVCSECEETVTRDDLRNLIADAQRLLRWLEMADEA